MTEKTLLVLSKHADEYAALLQAEGIESQPIFDCSQISSEHSGCQLLLGEPQLAVRALPQLPKLRWIQSTWAGLTPLVPAARAGIMVTGVKQIFDDQMKEYVLAYLLAHEIQILRRHHWQQEQLWQPTPTGSLKGKTLGVMGTGSIGQAIARGAQAFGMVLHGYSRSGGEAEPFRKVFESAALHDFLRGPDYLVVVMPDTPETTGLLDKRAFQAMRSHAVLINVGRGNAVNEADLIEALNQGQIGGAVLDVFAQEPLPKDHGFWKTPGLLMTAHVAAQSHPEDVAALFVENYRRWQGGHALLHAMDPERGY